MKKIFLPLLLLLVCSMQAMAASITASPVYIFTGTTNTITITGVGTSWTPGTPGSPTFTIAGATGVTITSQTVTSTTSATLTITNTATASATLTITDPSTTTTTPLGLSRRWFIRPDGGSQTQCTGTTNAAYTGGTTVQWIGKNAYTVGNTFVDTNNHLQRVTVAGTSSSTFAPSWSTTGGTVTDGTASEQDQGVMAVQSCALDHPFQMMNSGGNWAHMVGGDTIQFVPATSNSAGVSETYFTGERNNGVGQDWNPSVSGACVFANPADGSGSACILPAMPSGTAANHTRILGQNAGSCHDTNHTHLVNPTILSGIAVEFSVLSVRGSAYVDISCVELTQPDDCLPPVNVSDYPQCSNTTLSNYVRFGGLMFNYMTGPGPSNVTLTDFGAIGLTSSAINGSNTSGTITLSDIYFFGNASGWNGDGGGCGTSCESVGTYNISHMITDWEGCQAIRPINNTLPDTQMGFEYCADQQASYPLGDGFVQIAAGNLTLNVDHSKFRWNTQDGFDALHLSDDNTTSPAVHITDSWSEGNEGATFKIGAGTASTATNNVSVGNCRALLTESNFPLNKPGWSEGVELSCRAGGDEWSFQENNGTVITLENNTSVGYGATMYDVGCSALATSCFTTGGATFVFKNNISVSYPDPQGGQYAAAFFLGSGNVFANSGSVADHNLWWNNRTGCPTSTIVPTETNPICHDPLLVGESNIQAINPNLTSSSPARGAGVFISGLTVDYNGFTRPNPPAVGAIEYNAGSVTLSTVTVTPSSATILVAGTQTYAASCLYSDGSTTPCTIAWTDSAAHSSVNSTTGVVTGVSAGSDTITATFNSVAGTATITINAAPVFIPFMGGAVVRGNVH